MELKEEKNGELLLEISKAIGVATEEGSATELLIYRFNDNDKKIPIVILVGPVRKA